MSNRLHQALLSDDDLIVVVRSHLYMERLLNRLIEEMLPFPRRLSKTRIGWDQRIDLAMALGLKERYGAPLKKLGSIRNRFAHDPDAKIIKKDATDLLGALGPEDRSIVKKSLRESDMQSEREKIRTYEELSPRDQVILIVISLHSMLRIAISNVTGEQVGGNT